MWPTASAPDGSFYFDKAGPGHGHKNMATDAPIKVDPATVLILKPPAPVNPGVNPKPCVSPNGAVCWVAVTEEPASATAVVDLLADRADLIEAVTDLRWLEWDMLLNPSTVTGGMPPRFAGPGVAGFP